MRFLKDIFIIVLGISLTAILILIGVRIILYYR